MNPLILTLLTLLAVFLAVVGIYSLIADVTTRDRERASKRVDDEFRKRQREKASKHVLFKDLSPEALVAARQEDARLSLRQRFALLIEQSGLAVTPTRVVLLMVGAGLFFGLLGGLLHRNLITATVATVVAAVLPLAYVALKRKARLEKLSSQLPDAFDLMARVMRAGQTMSQAILAVADEFDQPIAAEFSYCFEQQNLGMPSELALRDLGRRTGLLEIKVFVLGLIIQQQTGGNLAEMLDKLAYIIRERFRMRGKIKALTAEGRLQAMILLGLPLFLLLVLYLLNPGYMSILFVHPYLLVGMFVFEGIGALWIRKIINFDF